MFCALRDRSRTTGSTRHRRTVGLIDDPLKPEEALSDAQRQAANDWYDHTLYSRQNGKRHASIVIIMQPAADVIEGGERLAPGMQRFAAPALEGSQPPDRFNLMHRLRMMWPKS